MLVGFLKFLKREKKEDALGDIDLPPAPPSLEDFDKSIPDFSDFGESNFSAKEGYMQKFDFPDIEDEIPKTDKEKIVQDFSALPKMEESPIMPIDINKPQNMIKPEIPMPQPTPPPKREDVILDAYKKTQSKNSEKERRILRQSMNTGEVYVRIDKFKATLGSINIIRNDLKRSEEKLIKLENIKNDKDNALDKIKSSMDDLQKKIIFVDKILFKGE